MHSLLSVIFLIGGFLWVRALERMHSDKSATDARYWQQSYEDLVKQTGRDLDDGLGPDPRRVEKQT